MCMCDRVWFRGETHSPLACSTVTFRTRLQPPVISASSMPALVTLFLFINSSCFLLNLINFKKKYLHFTTVIIIHWWVAHKNFPCTEHLTTTLPTLRKICHLLFEFIVKLTIVCFLCILSTSQEKPNSNPPAHIFNCFLTPPVLITGKWTSSQPQYFNY